MKTTQEYIEQLEKDLVNLGSRVQELEKQLAEACNGQLPEFAQLTPDTISFETVVSKESGEPVLVIRWMTHIAQMKAAQGREMGLNIIRVVEEGVSDAFLLKFLQEAFDIRGNEILLGVLSDFRHYRQTGQILNVEEPAVIVIATEPRQEVNAEQPKEKDETHTPGVQSASTV